VDELQPLAGPTLDAATFSKWGPELAARTGGGRLVLAGVSTDCCVLSTALAAADAGAEVQVVADACAGVDDASHARALDIMRLYSPLVEVTSLAEVLAGAGGD
jgi:nicotinamidase-related amidase